MDMPQTDAVLPIADVALLQTRAYIGGQWCDADSRRTLDVVNPASGERIGSIPNMGADETRRAIEAASAALPAWRAQTAKERSHITSDRVIWA